MSFTLYTVHMRPVPTGEVVEDVVLVPERGSVWAFIFGLFWALWHRMWLVAGLLALFVFFGGYIMDVPLSVSLGVSVLFALECFTLKRWTLSTRGYVEVGLVGADDEDQALEKFYSLLRCGDIAVPHLAEEPVSNPA